jgi:hypothetical protein
MVARSKVEPERRAAIRYRSNRKALVVINSAGSTQNASILNLSSKGALLQFEGIGVFPDTFELFIGDSRRRVSRIWTRGLKAGVVFED